MENKKDRKTLIFIPHKKPIELIRNGLDKTTKRSENVYDGFGGSGSTLIAWKKLVGIVG